MDQGDLEHTGTCPWNGSHTMIDDRRAGGLRAGREDLIGVRNNRYGH